ncbi:DUF4190 domain-containing protein [Nocardia sp. CDC159]|uniref:DUF4190 domain-containing protein n=1 Tax=Nocardia pulmonis TaxID=2951408 RepID=A0A9X2E9X4_9NOCA|nr:MULTISPECIES: DUF4190 domain-containing protein [Nocardia]MCM6776999.1 DUF4190 domain-containing protein [Nocardia pulmonis]MCM6789423.1 DUF4190 domain-containing protein [Nocardia sp. CDC159]
MTENPPPGQYPPPGQTPPPGQYPPGQNPPPPPGSYPPPPGQPYWQEQKGKGLAIAALVLGILALLSFWTIVGGILLGLAGLIIGIIATLKARRGAAAGGGMAIAGLVLSLIALIASIVVTVIGVSFFTSSGGKDFVDCVNKAGGDQAKLDQCERDWKQTLENKYSVTLTPAPSN